MLGPLPIGQVRLTSDLSNNIRKSASPRRPHGTLFKPRETILFCTRIHQAKNVILTQCSSSA